MRWTMGALIGQGAYGKVTMQISKDKSHVLIGSMALRVTSLALYERFNDDLALAFHTFCIQVFLGMNQDTGQFMAVKVQSPEWGGHYRAKPAGKSGFQDPWQAVRQVG